MRLCLSIQIEVPVFECRLYTLFAVGPSVISAWPFRIALEVGSHLDSSCPIVLLARNERDDGSPRQCGCNGGRRGEVVVRTKAGSDGEPRIVVLCVRKRGGSATTAIKRAGAGLWHFTLEAGPFGWGQGGREGARSRVEGTVMLGLTGLSESEIFAASSPADARRRPSCERMFFWLESPYALGSWDVPWLGLVELYARENRFHRS